MLLNDAENTYLLLVEKIREFRKEQGLKQSDLAKFLGVGTASYSDMERGRTKFTVVRLFAVLSYLGMDIFAEKKGDEIAVLGSPEEISAELKKHSRETRKVAKDVEMLRQQQDEILALLKGFLGNKARPENDKKSSGSSNG